MKFLFCFLLLTGVSFNNVFDQRFCRILLLMLKYTHKKRFFVIIFFVLIEYENDFRYISLYLPLLSVLLPVIGLAAPVSHYCADLTSACTAGEFGNTTWSSH